MKTIATINFKGGVGKTTITWLLAKFAAEEMNKSILIMDTDAQMSLTFAVHLEEGTGNLESKFGTWYEKQHKLKRKTLLDAIDKYDSAKGVFDFPIDPSFIYQMSKNLHFVPSVEELYWLELDVFDKQKTKNFMHALLSKIGYSRNFKYDYVFFDCPPNFTALSYSVLNCADLVLIPINPDCFASRGISLLIDGLKNRIEPWPNPNIAVFMNKAKTRLNKFTLETENYWDSAKRVCKEKKQQGLRIDPFDTFIPDRVDIKRAISERKFPKDFAHNISNLWHKIEDNLNEKFIKN